MRRTLTSTDIGDHVTKRKRFGLVLEGDPCGESMVEKSRGLMEFLQAIVWQPALILCGLTYPDKLAVLHNGTGFVLHAEVEADEP